MCGCCYVCVYGPGNPVAHITIEKPFIALNNKVVVVVFIFQMVIFICTHQVAYLAYSLTKTYLRKNYLKE